ncbi:HIT family protein [Actinotalea sp. K2]|uniref:HIT family protein n=1 Tax=Actinotalea sp. K2 TaxID=2939438 RepID=UPI002017D947|nr:HIT family protein [Actinotalea sp. K2]MCL3859468.1 HIT family protein [Actinotalea sp. K2]
MSVDDRSSGWNVVARRLGALEASPHMTEEVVAKECVFCAIVARRAEASMVFEDETVVVWMDLNPVTHGHLLVVPRRHAAGLEDLDAVTSAHVWSVGQDMARALRRSSLDCRGINFVVCDGEAALQTVFHFHLHVIPRYPGDGLGEPFKVETHEREKSLRDSDAQAVGAAIASTNRDVAPRP